LNITSTRRVSNSTLIKLIFLIFTCIFLQTVGYGQGQFGVRGGLNLSAMNYYFNEVKIERQEAAKKTEIGIFYEGNLKSSFDFIFELNYFTAGVSISELDFELSASAIEFNPMDKKV